MADTIAFPVKKPKRSKKLTFGVTIWMAQRFCLRIKGNKSDLVVDPQLMRKGDPA